MKCLKASWVSRCFNMMCLDVFTYLNMILYFPSHGLLLFWWVFRSVCVSSITLRADLQRKTLRLFFSLSFLSSCLLKVCSCCRGQAVYFAYWVSTNLSRSEHVAPELVLPQRWTELRSDAAEARLYGAHRDWKEGKLECQQCSGLFSKQRCCFITKQALDFYDVCEVSALFCTLSSCYCCGVSWPAHPWCMELAAKH